MKTLIAYFSFGGNTALAAGLLRSSLNADVHEIKLLKDKKRSGPGKFFWALSQVLGNKRPAVKPFADDINKYDLILLGTPVWAGNPSPALLSFIDQAKIANKKIALFCTSAGGEGKAFVKLKTVLANNTIAGEINFTKPAETKPDELKKKAEDWAKTLK